MAYLSHTYIKERWRAGASLCAIAQEANTNNAQIKYILAYLGELSEGAPLIIEDNRHPIHDAHNAPPLVKRARALKRAGYTCTQIAAEVGRGRPWVTQHTKDIQGADARRHGRTAPATYEQLKEQTNERTRARRARLKAQAAQTHRGGQNSMSPAPKTPKTPAPKFSPEVRAARRAYQNAHAARAKAGKALRALSPALMRRAVDLARKHATAAQRIYTTAGGAHPDAPTLKSLAHRTAAAYAAALSLAARLDAPTPTTTPTPESKTP